MPSELQTHRFDYNYEPVLQHLNMFTLEKRKMIANILFLFRIINNFIDSSSTRGLRFLRYTLVFRIGNFSRITLVRCIDALPEFVSYQLGFQIEMTFTIYYVLFAYLYYLLFLLYFWFFTVLFLYWELISSVHLLYLFLLATVSAFTLQDNYSLTTK